MASASPISGRFWYGASRSARALRAACSWASSSSTWRAGESTTGRCRQALRRDEEAAVWPECPRFGGSVAMGCPRPEETPDGHKTSSSSRSQGALAIILRHLFRQLRLKGQSRRVRRLRPHGAGNGVLWAAGPIAQWTRAVSPPDCHVSVLRRQRDPHPPNPTGVDIREAGYHFPTCGVVGRGVPEHRARYLSEKPPSGSGTAW